MKRDVPTLATERAFWNAGFSWVAGVDEVGRGALAGPLVAAAVILPPGNGVACRRLRASLAGVRDSKLLLPAQRRDLMTPIRAIAAAVAIGIVEANELDEIGVVAANRLAMERAVAGLSIPPEILLLDACVVDLGMPQVGLIDGDARCLTIAAASIVAKVTRDHMMIEADGADPRYQFSRHKGYASLAHRQALARSGPGPLHRRSFAPVRHMLAEPVGD